MKADVLGKLWALPIQRKTIYAKCSESIIERVYRIWLAPGDIAVDCGANAGRHLFPLSEAVGETGKVFGFEPIPALAEALSKKISDRSWDERVKVECLAVAESSRVSSFHHNLNAPAMSGLKVRGGLPEGSKEEILQVRVEPLDKLMTGKAPKFIKIDVEGAEFPVFQGATNLMAKVRPLFAFEDGRGGSAALNNYKMVDFYAFFEQRQYIVLDIFGFPVTSAMNGYGGPWNFYAVPSEKLEEAREAIVYGSMYELWALTPGA